MSGIADTKIIDLVTASRNGDAELIIVEDSKVTSDYANSLLAKINSYISFLKGGQFQKMYPELANKPVRIVLMSSFQPDEKSVQGFAQINSTLDKQYDIGFEFRLMK